MLFSSLPFFVFFAIYFLLHLTIPLRFRGYLIIAGSTVFYAWWKIEFVWLPYVLMAIAFWGVEWMQATSDSLTRRRRATAAIVLMFLPLLFFKYTNFIYKDVLGHFFGFHQRLLNVSLPLGVSFVTFTLVAYIVDVYQGRFTGGTRPVTLLQYVLFFPHLIAGPILRPIELIPQLEHPKTHRKIPYTLAISIFTVGLVKKLVFADQIGEAVDQIYRLPGTPDAPSSLLALYGFSAQIYCDFSGYTDMAIGLAMLIGVTLPNNFARPYAAANLVDFWRRWHITLSSWLRDYLYIPLGGNRGGRLAEFKNVMITMTLGGLWHGANWTFVIWGILHGLGVATVHRLKRFNALRAMPRWLSLLITFHFVTVAWAFFRAPDTSIAVKMLAAPVNGTWTAMSPFAGKHLFTLVLLFFFFVLHRLDDHRRIKLATRRVQPVFIWAVLVFLWIMAITVSQGSSAKFVYFDF